MSSASDNSFTALSGTPSIGSSPTTMKKRSVISLACGTCRKRKTKCDGKTPICTQCVNIGKENQCIYDVNTDRRRLWHVRQKQSVAQRLKQAEGLIERIRQGGKEAEDAMREILSIRHNNENNNDRTIIKSKNHSSSITEAQLSPETEDSGESDLVLDEEGQVHFFGGTSNLPEIKQSHTISGRTGINIIANASALSSSSPPPMSLTGPNSNPIETSSVDLSAMSPPTSPPLGGEFYTVQSVDVPVPLVRHLLDLYFCWQHTYYNVFSKDLFIQDLDTGGKFYSKFLLNAILAHAAQLCDVGFLRSDPSDPSTAGYMFLSEARAQIDQELLKRSLTTIQGLLVLASLEAGIGRDPVGWIYSGMAFRMALDLGLHLDCRSLLDCGLITKQDYIVRNATFWGCYLFDQGWSSYLGRPSVIHLCDITVERPEFMVNEQPIEWRPVFNNSPTQPLSQRIVGSPVPFYTQNTLTAILRLSEIIEETQASLYTPKRNQERQNAAQVQEKVKYLFNKLTSWESSLPTEMRQGKGEGADHPSVLLLYTLYYATKIFLFRPFVKIRDNSSSRPAALASSGINQNTTGSGGGALYQCLDAATNIVNRLRRFRDLYTLRLATNMSVYISFTAATTSFAKPGDEALERQLAECMEFLKEIGQCWTSANSIVEGIKARLFSQSNQTHAANVSSANPSEQMIPFSPFTIGTPNYFEYHDFYIYETVPDFEFLTDTTSSRGGTE